MATPPAVTLRTPRLALRPLGESGVGALHAIDTDPVVRRFLRDDRGTGGAAWPRTRRAR